MKYNWYSLISGKLQKQNTQFAWPTVDSGQFGGIWLDVEEAGTDELRLFFAPLDLHPLQMAHCLD